MAQDRGGGEPAVEASPSTRAVCPVRFHEALRASASQRLFLDEDRSGAALPEILTSPVESIALMVGPEGGWPDHERAEARDEWVDGSIHRRTRLADGDCRDRSDSSVNALLRR